MIQVWMSLRQEIDGGWLCIATDVHGDEVTHDRTNHPNSALGMVVNTLTMLYETVEIVHLERLHGN
jgi:hypothetical protein